MAELAQMGVHLCHPPSRVLRLRVCFQGEDVGGGDGGGKGGKGGGGEEGKADGKPTHTTEETEGKEGRDGKEGQEEKERRERRNWNLREKILSTLEGFGEVTSVTTSPSWASMEGTNMDTEDTALNTTKDTAMGGDDAKVDTRTTVSQRAIAERLLTAIASELVKEADEGIAGSIAKGQRPEQWIDASMMNEVIEHARKLRGLRDDSTSPTTDTTGADSLAALAAWDCHECSTPNDAGTTECGLCGTERGSGGDGGDGGGGGASLVSSASSASAAAAAAGLMFVRFSSKEDAVNARVGIPEPWVLPWTLDDASTSGGKRTMVKVEIGFYPEKQFLWRDYRIDVRYK